jgi:ribosomal protein L16 Arg81 hydroxylase
MRAALKSSADAGFAMRRTPSEPRGKILGGRTELAAEYSAGSILQFPRLELFLPPGDELVTFADELSRCLDRALLSITAFEAPTKGSAIPPHVDETAVLTFQLRGLRRWEIGDRFDANDPRVLGAGEWSSRAHVVLEPGMAMYVPPGTAHHVAGLGPTSSMAFIFDGRQTQADLTT